MDIDVHSDDVWKVNLYPKTFEISYFTRNHMDGFVSFLLLVL